MEKHFTIQEYKQKLQNPVFTHLLKKLLKAIAERAKENTKPGFKKCGVFLYDWFQVIQGIPAEIACQEQKVDERKV